MKLELPPAIPLPQELDPLPALLTFKQLQRLVEFWNLGGRRHAVDLRDCEVIQSVTRFPKGQRARYASEDVLKLYPAKPQP